MLSSASTLPASAITGTPCACASADTAAGALPIAVCSSSRPSPVKTRSASAMYCSSLVSWITSCEPGSNSAPSIARNAKPRPPAAPEPGVAGSCFPQNSRTSSAYRRSASSITGMSSALAPFCGPNTALQPSGPHRGLVTSQATRKVHFLMISCSAPGFGSANLPGFGSAGAPSTVSADSPGHGIAGGAIAASFISPAAPCPMLLPSASVRR